MKYIFVWTYNRLLEAQLQTQSRQHGDELEALHTQIELLRDDIEKKQEILSYTASLSPEARVEYSVQQEITRLTNDNLVRTGSRGQQLGGEATLIAMLSLSVGPQGASGETGEEREEAKEAAQDLHEEGSGARR